MAVAALKNDAYAYANPIPVEVEPVAIPRVADIPIAVPRPSYKPRLSAFSVLGFLFVGFLAVICALSQVELTRVSAEIAGVKAVRGRVEAKIGVSQYLDTLQAENRALKIEYERTFDLTAIELYATRELGMVNYTRTSAAVTRTVVPQDKAVVPESEGESAVGEIKAYLVTLTEYFK